MESKNKGYDRDFPKFCKVCRAVATGKASRQTFLLIFKTFKLTWHSFKLPVGIRLSLCSAYIYLILEAHPMLLKKKLCKEPSNGY